MEHLAQQALLDRPKPQSVIVPKGYSSYWGVDGSTRGVAIGWVYEDGRRGVVEAPFPKLPMPQRLAEIRVITEALATGLAFMGDQVKPGIVAVEQPSGDISNLELVYAVGLVMCGLVDALGGGTRFEIVTSGWWKLRACGRGNISKTQPSAVKGRRGKPLPLEEYPVMQWARLNGYAGSSWDCADAMGMAEGARSEWALLER